MKPKHMGILLAGLFAGHAWAAEPAMEPDWPQANGPFGNFTPRQYGVKLVDDLGQAKQLWVSETKALGRAKGSASGYVSMLADPTTHAGSSSGLIVAEGKLFASSFRPHGDVWTEKQVRIAMDLKKFTGEKLEALKRNTAVDADDLTVAIDLKTGKTAWEAIEQSKGLNRAAGKRLQFHGTPAYFGGRVFSLGTMGRVYCYNAADGKKLWEDETGALVKPAAELKEKMRKDRDTLPGGEGMGMSLVVADGVLIVPQYPGGQDVALRGMDARTGKTLWEVPAATSRFATPAVWTHQGKPHLLVATIKGDLRLIDPKIGKVLWMVGGLEPIYYPLTASATHVFVNVKSASTNPKKDGQSWGRIGAYRISPEKAERAWEAPDKPAFWFENHMDVCAMRRVAVRDGRVYYFVQGHSENPGSCSRFFSILDEKTGEVLLSTTALSGSPQFFLVEDRLLVLPDAAHSDRTTLELYTLDPKDFRRVGQPWKPPHHNSTAYEVFIELPYVDGCFFMRTWQGEVVCYDLRKH
jgi:outer membrane protein assembly factor BamB